MIITNIDSESGRFNISADPAGMKYLIDCTKPGSSLHTRLLAGYDNLLLAGRWRDATTPKGADEKGE